jgi:multidrug efflux pump subunit AcrA (membrane-fusion protein)
MRRLAPDLVRGLVVWLAVTAGSCSEREVSQPQQNAPAPAVPIAAAAAVRKDMPLEVSVIGTVEAYSTVTVRAQITGELTAVKFEQGDDVQEGQELFTLDRRPLEAALLQATATLERAGDPGAAGAAGPAGHCRAGDTRYRTCTGGRARSDVGVRSRGD